MEVVELVACCSVFFFLYMYPVGFFAQFRAMITMIGPQDIFLLFILVSKNLTLYNKIPSLNLTKRQNFTLVQFKAFVDDKINVTKILKFVLGKGENGGILILFNFVSCNSFQCGQPRVTLKLGIDNGGSCELPLPLPSVQSSQIQLLLLSSNMKLCLKNFVGTQWNERKKFVRLHLLV